MESWRALGHMRCALDLEAWMEGQLLAVSFELYTGQPGRRGSFPKKASAMISPHDTAFPARYQGTLPLSLCGLA